MERPLRLEALGAGDVRAVRVELGFTPPRAPAEERGHPIRDALGAVEALTRAGADAGPPEQHVLERHGQLVLHGEMELGHDVGVHGTETCCSGGPASAPARVRASTAPRA